MHGAPQGVLASLAGSSLESAFAVNPAVVRLQMVRALAEAWQLRWPAVPLSPCNPGATVQLVSCGSSVAPTVPGDKQWREAERRWRAREAQSGASFDIRMASNSWTLLLSRDKFPRETPEGSALGQCPHMLPKLTVVVDATRKSRLWRAV